MPRHATSTSFKPGRVVSEVERQKHSNTLKLLISEGKGHVPTNPWSEESKAKLRRTFEEKGHPRERLLFSRRLQKCGSRTYYQIKVSKKGRWVYEHRYIAEQMLGHQLAPGEVVHHINNNPLDNRPENLQVVSHGQHTSIHHRGVPSPLKGKRRISGFSILHPCCVLCGRSDVKHASKGVCRPCWHKEYRKHKTLQRLQLEALVNDRGG
jgi:HNH endonuclease